jgi:1,4-alpha-glucan branching enzyme
MLYKQTLDNGKVRVTFSLPEHIWADCIALVGDFNHWDRHTHTLRQTRGDGSWHISLDLEPKCSYRFRYLVDGEGWMDDDHADGCEPNPYGGYDSVVVT